MTHHLIMLNLHGEHYPLMHTHTHTHTHTLGHYPKIDATVMGTISLLIHMAELQRNLLSSALPVFCRILVFFLGLF